MSQFATVPNARRLEWFDYAKGICILLVVMMHSTLGVGEAFGGSGFMHDVVAYARPFRMPDFFLLSGLFLANVIDRDWRTYLDRKVVHFAYFYVLWLGIQTVVKSGARLGHDPLAWIAEFATAAVSPFPTLWFIYILPVFFVATKLLRRVDPVALWLAAAALQIAPVHTGWAAIDHFAARYFVFFLSGYLAAPAVFRLAVWAREHVAGTLAALGLWAVFNGYLALTPTGLPGGSRLADLPLISLSAGLVGATAIVAIASLLSRFDPLPFIRYAGKNSIVLYCSFVLPMAAARVGMLKSGLVHSVGLASLLTWIAAVITPLAVHAYVRNSRARFLFERPEWFKLKPAASPSILATAAPSAPSRALQRRILSVTRQPLPQRAARLRAVQVRQTGLKVG
jgi:uncharacterized membrane protein YcfT